MPIQAIPNRLKRTTIGCGIHGNECLALAVCGRAGDWRIAWGVHCAVDDPGFVKHLRSEARTGALVWRWPLWVPPRENQKNQTEVRALELSEKKSKSKYNDYVQTQIRQLFASDPFRFVFSKGIHVVGPQKEVHEIGIGIRTDVIKKEYLFWRQKRKMIHPHVAPVAAAIANTFLALYPEEDASDHALRLLFLPGPVFSYAVLMDDWRLIDSVRQPMMRQQSFTEEVLDDLKEDIIHRNRKRNVARMRLCVITGDEYRNLKGKIEFWSPFLEPASLRMNQKTKDLVENHTSKATVAFGMALQGGQ